MNVGEATVTPTPDMSPVDELLAAESDRDKRARELGDALTALLGDVETYRKAWKQALGHRLRQDRSAARGIHRPGQAPPPQAHLRRDPCARGTSSNRPTH